MLPPCAFNQQGEKALATSSSRSRCTRKAAPLHHQLERPQKGPTGAGISTVSLCVSQARPVWQRDAGRAGRLERGSEPHATGTQKVAATRRTTSAAWARATPSYAGGAWRHAMPAVLLMLTRVQYDEVSAAARGERAIRAEGVCDAREPSVIRSPGQQSSCLPLCQDRRI